MKHIDALLKSVSSVVEDGDDLVVCLLIGKSKRQEVYRRLKQDGFNVVKYGETGVHITLSNEDVRSSL